MFWREEAAQLAGRSANNHQTDREEGRDNVRGSRFQQGAREYGGRVLRSHKVRCSQRAHSIRKDSIKVFGKSKPHSVLVVFPATSNTVESKHRYDSRI
jgi:hypothetical protein